VKRLAFRVVLIAFVAGALAGCVDSAGPILTDARPMFGPQLRLQFYGLRKGHVDDPEQADYAWRDGHYQRVRGGMTDTQGFTVHPLEGDDFIVQSVPADRTHRVEYALAHTLVPGVYQVVPIDENDADAATRAANCPRRAGSSCRIETREQLFALARATAARRSDKGGLAIRLPDQPERGQTPAPR
jgi:hypothetical protein